MLVEEKEDILNNNQEVKLVMFVENLDILLEIANKTDVKIS